MATKLEGRGQGLSSRETKKLTLVIPVMSDVVMSDVTLYRDQTSRLGVEKSMHARGRIRLKHRVLYLPW